jgi:beta-glucanase (GH16 family)
VPYDIAQHDKEHDVEKMWPPEIDAMEIIGSKPNDVLMTYHWKSPNGQPIKDVSTYSNLTQPNGWHTYAVNWEPGYIDWYVDGKLRKSVSGSSVPSKSMEIIINLAIGGTLPGYPDLSTLKSASVGIDYVKVYQLTNKASK